MPRYFARTAAALAAAMLAGSAGPADALPTLQLDVIGGVYVGGSEETTFAVSDVFTLKTLLVPDGDSGLAHTYYLAMALFPADATIGTFLFDDPADAAPADTVNVPAEMTYGTHPYLASHGVYPTWYRDVSFTFDGSDVEPVAYNSEGGATDPTKTQYFHLFDVDTSGLLPGWSLHFDLYQLGLQNQKKVSSLTLIEKAPFSHDASSCTLGEACDPPPVVPEPATLLLLGSGLAGAGLARSKGKGQKAKGRYKALGLRP